METEGDERQNTETKSYLKENSGKTIKEKVMLKVRYCFKNDMPFSI